MKKRMEPFFEEIALRAASFDELLSNDFVTLPGQKTDAERAARRLAAWCKASAAGNWSDFDRRLQKDNCSYGEALARFSTVRWNPLASKPQWLGDAVWIERALRKTVAVGVNRRARVKQPFDELYVALASSAQARVWRRFRPSGTKLFSRSFKEDVRRQLITSVAELCASTLYTCYSQRRAVSEPQSPQNTYGYQEFVRDMASGEIRALLLDNPVLLRLISVLVRNWIEGTKELVDRLICDRELLRRELGHSERVRITGYSGCMSDPHNGGRTVALIHFSDETKILYKPRDLLPDASWHSLVKDLQEIGAPVELRAAYVIARTGYGWAKFTEHAKCISIQEVHDFYVRAGALSALLHLLCGCDFHEENIIADGAYPVPIDLETILHSDLEWHRSDEMQADAFAKAMERIFSSVLTVGMLPSYGRSPRNNMFGTGGMNSDVARESELVWDKLHSDEIIPIRRFRDAGDVSNLPYFNGYAQSFREFIEQFINGFLLYSRFILGVRDTRGCDFLLGRFSGLCVRRLYRPTRAYCMLINRLKNARTFDDGVIWSVQADFFSRLASWEDQDATLWALQRIERNALLQLDVPYLIAATDQPRVGDRDGGTAVFRGVSGLELARRRIESLDERELKWQSEVIRHSVVRKAERMVSPLNVEITTAGSVIESRNVFSSESDDIARELRAQAFRSEKNAAWIGFDWLGDSQFGQLSVLGPDLYAGAIGIAVFLAAHGSVAGDGSSRETAGAAFEDLFSRLRGPRAPRMVRSLGIGGGTGFGSIVYAMAVAANFLDDNRLLEEAVTASALVTDDVIGADTHLDVLNGSAGAILGLLKVYRASRCSEVLERALKCGEHLLNTERYGQVGSRCWKEISSGQPLTGMSHGAAGFAYSLASLAAATGQEAFADAAKECLAYENSCFDPSRSDWPDLRGMGGVLWPCSWCHGAPGIGLARIAIGNAGGALALTELDRRRLNEDVLAAWRAVQANWPSTNDTMCCGTLGGIEFLREAGNLLDDASAVDLANERLYHVVKTASIAGDYRWYAGNRRFNIGLFRGLSGIGYSCLRVLEPSLPNLLLWE